MRISIGHKLIAVVVLPAILAAALAAFTLVEMRLERQRFGQIEALSAISSRAGDMTVALQALVIAANAVIIEPDSLGRAAPAPPT